MVATHVDAKQLSIVHYNSTCKNIGCPAGLFYETLKCISECRCGESQVKNYKDPITGATHDACVPGELCI